MFGVWKGNVPLALASLAFNQVHALTEWRWRTSVGALAAVGWRWQVGVRVGGYEVTLTLDMVWWRWHCYATIDEGLDVSTLSLFLSRLTFTISETTVEFCVCSRFAYFMASRGKEGSD